MFVRLLGAIKYAFSKKKMILGAFCGLNLLSTGRYGHMDDKLANNKNYNKNNNKSVQ